MEAAVGEQETVELFVESADFIDELRAVQGIDLGLDLLSEEHGGSGGVDDEDAGKGGVGVGDVDLGALLKIGVIVY